MTMVLPIVVNEVKVTGTDISYSEGQNHLYLQLVEIGNEIELKATIAEDSFMAHALGAMDGKVLATVSFVDILAKLSAVDENAVIG